MQPSSEVDVSFGGGEPRNYGDKSEPQLFEGGQEIPASSNKAPVINDAANRSPSKNARENIADEGSPKGN